MPKLNQRNIMNKYRQDQIEVSLNEALKKMENMNLNLGIRISTKDIKQMLSDSHKIYKNVKSKKKQELGSSLYSGHYIYLVYEYGHYYYIGQSRQIDQRLKDHMRIKESVKNKTRDYYAKKSKVVEYLNEDDNLKEALDNMKILVIDLTEEINEYGIKIGIKRNKLRKNLKLKTLREAIETDAMKNVEKYFGISPEKLGKNLNEVPQGKRSEMTRLDQVSSRHFKILMDFKEHGYIIPKCEEYKKISILKEDILKKETLKQLNILFEEVRKQLEF